MLNEKRLNKGSFEYSQTFKNFEKNSIKLVRQQKLLRNKVLLDREEVQRFQHE